MPAVVGTVIRSIRRLPIVLDNHRARHDISIEIADESPGTVAIHGHTGTHAGDIEEGRTGRLVRRTRIGCRVKPPGKGDAIAGGNGGRRPGGGGSHVLRGDGIQGEITGTDIGGTVQGGPVDQGGVITALTRGEIGNGRHGDMIVPLTKSVCI